MFALDRVKNSRVVFGQLLVIALCVLPSALRAQLFAPLYPAVDSIVAGPGTNEATVYFSYASEANATQFRSVGGANFCLPGPINRGQPTQFLPMGELRKFSMTWVTNTFNSASWTVGSATATASVDLIDKLAQGNQTFRYSATLSDTNSAGDGLYQMMFVLLDPTGSQSAGPLIYTNGITVTNRGFTVDLSYPTYLSRDEPYAFDVYGTTNGGASISFAPRRSMVLRSAPTNDTGNALRLTSNFQFVNVTNVIDPGTSISIGAWIKTTQGTRGDVISKLGPGSAGFVLNVQTNGRVGFWVGDLAASYLIGNKIVNDGKWHYVAGTFDGSVASIYVDGVLDVSASRVGTLNAAINSCIGNCTACGTNNQFIGDIDELTIWNTALSAAAIQNFTTTLPSPTNAGLIAYFKFDEANETTFFDSTTNRIRGTLVNSVLHVPSDAPVGTKVQTLAATDLRFNMAVMNAAVIPNGIDTGVRLEWGTSEAYGNSTAWQSVGLGTNIIALTQQLLDLQPNVTYHFRIHATNALGTILGQDQTFKLSSSGYALSFTSTNASVTVTQSTPALNLFPLTITAWVKTTDDAGGIVNKYMGGSYNGYNLYLENGSIRAWYFRDSANYIWDGGSGLNGGYVADNAWHYIVFTVETNGGKLYVDGALKNSIGWNGPPGATTTSQPLRLGIYDSLSFTGQMDEVSLWNVALQDTAIQQYRDHSILGNEPGLVAFWRADEGTGTSVADITGHGYTGNFGSSVSWTNQTEFNARFPIAFTLDATAVTNVSATLNGLINPYTLASGGWFQYGTSTSYGNNSSAQAVGAGASNLPVSINVTGLASKTTYHFRLAATNAVGISYGVDQTFRTFGSPDVTTSPVSDAGKDRTVLNASVIADGVISTAWFEWGATTNYEYQTAAGAVGSATTPITFSQPISNLVMSASYHYRVVASNMYGITYGADLSFQVPRFSDGGIGFPGVVLGAARWGDYDSDGKLDALVAGSGSAHLYHNSGSNTFVDSGFSLPGVNNGGADFGDYDNDGWIDIAFSGGSGGGLLRNNSGVGFTNMVTGIPGLDQSDIAFADFDNDGKRDIIISGHAGSFQGYFFRNSGSNTFVNSGTPITGAYGCHIAWGDYDNDGYVDFAISGYTGVTGTFLYHNRGDGNFDNVMQLSFGEFGEMAWGDYDGDGDLDLVVTGLSSGQAPSAVIYRNDGNGRFTNIGAPLTGVYFSTACWGDFDNDGDLDLLISGRSIFSSCLCGTANPVTKLYRNDGSDTFTDISELLPALEWSSAAWGDYDNDGRLDILITGKTAADAPFARVLHNDLLIASNTPPSSPGGLSSAVFETSVTLRWSAGTDAETSSNGLYYNVRVGTTPGGCEIISPASAADGTHRIPDFGNAQSSRLAVLRNLKPNTTYYWSVQTIDAGFAASPFAPEQTFVTPSAPQLSITSVLPGATFAQVNGSINPSGDDTFVRVEWGTSTNYLNATAYSYVGNTMTFLPVTIALTNLAPNTFYHARLSALSAAGTKQSADYTFRTLVPSPVIGSFLAKTNGFEFQFNGVSGASYSVYVSTNLVDWSRLGGATQINQGLFRYVDAVSGLEKRFYQLRIP